MTKMMERYRMMSLVLLLVCTATAMAQTVTTRIVKGRVISASTRQPLAGALVRTAETSGYSTLTDEAGTYQLQVPQYCTSVDISAPDYNLVRCALGGDDRMGDVQLYPSTFRASYSEHTNWLSDSKADGFGYSPAVSIEEEIQKQLGAQVHTTMRSGTPGIGGVMMVDGLGSLNANAQPLVVVDGVIYDQQYSRQMLHEGFYNNILTNINPADIGQVTVLRNGTALYGAKGANGVLLIETRRNHSMATRITASLSAGITMQPKFIRMMNARQYRSYASELLKSANTSVSDFKFLNEDPGYYYYKLYHNDTDWKENVYHTAVTQNYGIHVEGGDAVADYRLSLGYTKAESTLRYNTMNRLNVRFNTDIRFSDRFHTRFDASYVNLSRNIRNDGAPASYDQGAIASPSFLAYAKSPFLSPYGYASGSMTSHLDVNDESYLDEALHRYTGYNYKLGNPYALNQYGDAENKNRFENAMFNVSVTPACQLLPDLELSEHFSYNLVNTSEKFYIPIYGMPDYYVERLADYRENEIRSLTSRQNSLMSDTRLSWQKRLGAHRLNLFGGVRVNWESYTMNSQLGYNSGNDKTPFIQTGNDSKPGGAEDDATNIAWYAQAGYDYRQRYYLQLNLTAETSSRFGRHADAGLKAFGARWALFPGVQAGWVLTNEKWFSRFSGIDYLRLSAGLDLTGNDDISHLAVRSYFASRQYLNNVLGLSLSNIGNSHIQWESTRRLHASLEGNFLRNRLNVRMSVFTTETTHLLTLQSLSVLTGLESHWGNGGTMTNKGFDVSLTGRLLTTPHWQWEMGASVGHYKNQVTSLPGGPQDAQLYGAAVRTMEGHAANVFYGYKSLGVFSTSEQAAQASLWQEGDNGSRSYFHAGDVHFADLDGNGCIDEADRTVIGDPNPDFYGNLFTSLSWRRFRLDANLTYSVGNDVYNYMRSQLEGGQRFMNQTVAMTSRWHGEGHETDVPRVTFQDPMGNSRFSDRWIEDGSYLRLKSVTLSYRLPVNSQFLQGLEFWVQGNNLLTVTRYLGSDPETAVTSGVIGQGIDTGLLPQSRSVVAGIKMNL